MEKNLNFLDRNEFNYSPSKEVVEALKNFDINKLCFYTRIYDEGKKSILSVFLSELYDIDETQVLLGYGGEDVPKAVYPSVRGSQRARLRRSRTDSIAKILRPTIWERRI